MAKAIIMGRSSRVGNYIEERNIDAENEAARREFIENDVFGEERFPAMSLEDLIKEKYIYVSEDYRLLTKNYYNGRFETVLIVD